MARLLTCACGYHWQAEAETFTSSGPTLCPGCGEPIMEASSGHEPPSAPTVSSVSSIRADASDDGTAPPQAADDGTLLHVEERLPAADSDAASVPGYEILKELGRGGMGVVYQARHIKLQRVVALKMILGGAHASKSDQARFRTEAEAIARLHHPGFVQIYEIGEHQDLPFFALEFCPGGSLDRKLRATLLPPLEAARLVETLARSMQVAHQKQIVHRDLKPANVLLAEGGAPKISDFGLAKLLDDQSGLTATGCTMGTPSYMAPEQIGSSDVPIGPAADIYALGAILYELLTGRPPFKATTALDTLRLVSTEEPVPPTRFQPATPRDLETIALKCLQKAPGKRYATADDLAEDLRRYQAGEPIRARPISIFERAGRWCRRHPLVPVVVAALAFCLAVFAQIALERRKLQIVGKDAAPSIIAAQHIKANLADMHRHGSQHLLVGAGRNSRAAAAGAERRGAAADGMLDAAANITYGEAEREPLRQLLHFLGKYEAAATRAVLLRERGESSYLQAHREADHILQEGLLTAADALDRANGEVVERLGSRPNGWARLVLAGVLMSGLGMMVVLALQQQGQPWNFNLVGATVLAGGMLAAALVTVWSAESCWRRARVDAFDSILVLERARAEAVAAHAALCRWLLEGARPENEQPFLDKSAKVLKLPQGVLPADFLAALDAGHASVGMDGYLAAELRNVTFEGELAAARGMVRAYAVYLISVAKVRQLAAAGKHDAAVALYIGEGPHEGNGSFARFDAALGDTVSINRREFDETIQRGFWMLGALEMLNPLAALIVASLAGVGLRRMHERFSG